MDILYVVGTGSKWCNNELKYSLRSIAKYGKNVGNVVLVGYKPHFVNEENVIYIPCEDIGNKKHERILNKILTAAKSGKLSDHFLISSDDHFYIKETDFDQLPVYYKKEEMVGSERKSYTRSILQTKKFLQDNGLTIYQTNPHCNTHFDINIYNKYKELFDKGVTLPDSVESNCLMGNLLIKEGWEPQYYRDVKVGRFKNRKELLEKIGDSECFSIYDHAVNYGVGDYLKELFPKRCKYEKPLII